MTNDRLVFLLINYKDTLLPSKYFLLMSNGSEGAIAQLPVGSSFVVSYLRLYPLTEQSCMLYCTVTDHRGPEMPLLIRCRGMWATVFEMTTFLYV